SWEGGQLGGGGKGNPGGKCFRFRCPFVFQVRGRERESGRTEDGWFPGENIQERNPNTRVLKLQQKNPGQVRRLENSAPATLTLGA
ncbi:hypothetical protein AMECASPLE_024980, partial [Ameca splendens]